MSRVAVPMIMRMSMRMVGPVLVAMITVVVIMAIVLETIRSLPHTVKLAMAGGRGHPSFYCRAAGAGGS